MFYSTDVFKNVGLSLNNAQAATTGVGAVSVFMTAIVVSSFRFHSSLMQITPLHVHRIQLTTRCNVSNNIARRHAKKLGFRTHFCHPCNVSDISRRTDFYKQTFCMHKQEWPNLQRMSNMKTRLIIYDLCSNVIIVKRGQHRGSYYIYVYIPFSQQIVFRA